MSSGREVAGSSWVVAGVFRVPGEEVEPPEPEEALSLLLQRELEWDCSFDGVFTRTLFSSASLCESDSYGLKLDLEVTGEQLLIEEAGEALSRESLFFDLSDEEMLFILEESAPI